jgi:hypothetical protein
MDAKTVQTLAIGDIIAYTLSTEQKPTNPQRTYRGVVKRIDHKAQRVIVTLLDEVYEALCEPVGMSQIQSIAKPQHEDRKRARPPSSRLENV